MLQATDTAIAESEIKEEENTMFVFAIETCGSTVAFTREVNRTMLDGILNGQRDEGQHLRKTLLFIKSKTVWDGVSPFTARLATDSEDLEYSVTADDLDIGDDESVLLFPVSERDGARFSGLRCAVRPKP